MTRYYRRVIRIVAEDSPNVRFALEQIKRGITPTNEIIVPGVLSYDDYCKRRDTWDEIQKAVSLWARFYEGPELKLFPSAWLERAKLLADKLEGKPRKAKAVGIDPAEGGDRTAMVGVDELGVIKLVSRKTPDTDVIPREALAFAMELGCPPESICFDRGGGGKQAADRLRAQGFNVRTIGFGEAISLDPKRGLQSVEKRLETKEEKYVYVNRRAEMIWELSLMDNFAIPRRYAIDPEPGRKSVFFQLSKYPKQYDQEGRCKVPPKQKKNPDSDEECMVDKIGHSPDESDALILAVHGLLHPKRPAMAGGF